MPFSYEKKITGNFPVEFSALAFSLVALKLSCGYIRFGEAKGEPWRLEGNLGSFLGRYLIMVFIENESFYL